MFWFKKPKKLNETTRLYALYGESANLSFLDSAIKDNNSKIDINTNNIETNRNNIVANANRIEEVNDKVDNIPTVDLTEVNNRINNNTRNIATNVTNINNLNGKINTNTTNINNLSGKINTNTTNINNIQTKVNTNTTNINNLDTKITRVNSESAKLNGVTDQRWQSSNIFANNTGFAARINMNNNKIINLATPTSDNEAATKQYVDMKAASIKQEVVSFSIYYNHSLTLSDPIYWSEGRIRTFIFPAQQSFNPRVDKPIKYGDYIIYANFKIHFPGDRYIHYVTTSQPHFNLGEGHNIPIKIENTGFFTAPVDAGVPKQVTLVSISGIKV